MPRRFEFHKNGLEQHQCRSWQEGQWLFFHCPECGYSRKLNWANGDTKLLKAGNEEALHRGMHHPPTELAQQISDS